MMQDSRTIFLIVLLAFLSSICLAYAAWLISRRKASKRRLMNRILGETEEILTKNYQVNRKPKIDFVKFLPSGYLVFLRSKLSKSGQLGDEFLKKLIKRKFIFALSLLLLGAFYFLPSGGILKMALAAVFGFFLPDILLTNTIQKRAETIQVALPDAVEMLTMCVEAGLSFQQSLQRVSENQNNVISTEFARVLSEIQIGEARLVALSNMGNRLNHPDVSRFVTAMLQVDRLGIPISSVLNQQVDELRSRAKMRAREQAQKVPVKILGPVMVCFMPCTLIIVLGPVILSFVS